MDNLETTIANGVSLATVLVIERVWTRLYAAYRRRKMANGEGLRKAIHATAAMFASVEWLHDQLADTEGYHSLRLLCAHNSGHDLRTTKFLKGTVMATRPREMQYEWREQQLDSEYLSHVIGPITTTHRKSVHRSELSPQGQLGAIYAKLGVEQSLVFLVDRNEREIIYVDVSFSHGGQLLPEQLESIRIAQSEAMAARRL